MVGGGVHGKGVGIAHVTMTEVGLIIIKFRAFISMYTQNGEGTTETVIGMDTGGTTNGSLTNSFKKTGRAGKIIDIGRGKEPGVSRAINLNHTSRDRN